jgi:hypothetical protein
MMILMMKMKCVRNLQILLRDGGDERLRLIWLMKVFQNEDMN